MRRKRRKEKKGETYTNYPSTRKYKKIQENFKNVETTRHSVIQPVITIFTGPYVFLLIALPIYILYFLINK